MIWHPWTIAWTTLVAAGSLLTWYGWRGWREGDHPFCRRCGFDLSGRTEGTKVCSECGADLAARGAIIIGEPRRRPRMVIGGIAMAVIGFSALFAVIGVSALFNLNTWKPYPLLAREIESIDPVVRRDAALEVIRRIGTNQLSSSQVKTIVANTLAWQADRTRAWPSGWGFVIQEARKGGFVTAEQWTQYLVNSSDPRLRLRPANRLGEPIPYEFHVQDRGHLSSWAEGRIVGCTIDGKDVRYVAHPRDFIDGQPHSRSWRGVLEVDKADLSKLSPGEHKLKVQLELTCYDRVREPRALLGTRTIDETSPLTLTPRDAELISFTSDANTDAAVQRSLTLGIAQPFARSATTLSLLRGEDTVYVAISADGPPISLAHDVFLRTPQREWPLGSFTCPAGATRRFSFEPQIADLPDSPEMPRADIVLRPNRQIAQEAMDLGPNVWGGELAFRDVTLRGGPFNRRTSRPSKR